ncbi:MAG TPA: chemotaxis protein CheB [Pyrinomonadaceae bacterium]
MSNKDIIVVGASAGGIEALKTLVSGLPRKFPATVFIVLHMSPETPSVLPEILTRAGELSARHPRDKEEFRPGQIYVAPPDHHLLVESDNRVRVTRGPKENRFRPAVDPLFRSAARSYGTRVIGIVLSGGLDDGTVGLLAIKQRGGLAVVQDPRDAITPSMPFNAMRHVAVDHCLPVAEIAPLLVRLTDEHAGEEGEHPVSEELEIEVKIAREDNAKDAGVLRLGEASMFTCPECHGTLLELNSKEPLRFRCHTGHAFTVNSLLAELTENVEDSLWTTIRAIQESAMLMKHLAEHLSHGENDAAAQLFLKKAREAEQRGELVRQAVMNHEKLSEDRIEETTK